MKATRQVAQRVSYHWLMLCYAYALLHWDSIQGFGGNAPDRASKMDIVRHNLILEAFLLHARILHDFLSGRAKTQDDISVIHFLESPDRWPAESTLFTKLQVNRTRLNKMLAHLTYRGAKYVELEDKHWPFVDFHNELKDAWKLFMSELDSERRLWFPAEIQPRSIRID